MTKHLDNKISTQCKQDRYIHAPVLLWNVKPEFHNGTQVSKPQKTLKQFDMKCKTGIMSAITVSLEVYYGLQWYFNAFWFFTSGVMLPPSLWIDSSLSYLFGWMTEDSGHTEVQSEKLLDVSLATPCLVRRLAGWYVIYISHQLMLFLSRLLLGSWLEWQTSVAFVLRAPAVFMSDSPWHATVLVLLYVGFSVLPNASKNNDFKMKTYLSYIKTCMLISYSHSV